MRFGQTLAVGLALNAALAAGVQAGAIRPGGGPGSSGPGSISVSSGPYSAILSRNIFDLQKPGKIALPPEKPPVLPNVKLIGLMDISGRPQAVFSISEPGTVGKTPIPCIMSANQMQSGVEVLAIDLVAKSARIQMGENISVIFLEEPKGTTGGVTAPAGPGMGAGASRPPGYPPTKPGGFVNGPAGFGNQSLPGAYNPNAGGDPNAAMGDAGAIPNRQVRTDPPPIPMEQQVQNIEAQRQQLIDAGRSDIADQILPITPATSQENLNRVLTPGASAQNQNSQGQQQTTTPANNGPAWGGPVYRGPNGVLIPGAVK